MIRKGDEITVVLDTSRTGVKAIEAFVSGVYGNNGQPQLQWRSRYAEAHGKPVIPMFQLLADEDLTWCKGWDQESKDALVVTYALRPEDKQQRPRRTSLLRKLRTRR